MSSLQDFDLQGYVWPKNGALPCAFDFLCLTVRIVSLLDVTNQFNFVGATTSDRVEDTGCKPAPAIMCSIHLL